MFEQAIRAKVRFETPQGALMLEDLWDLPLQSHSGRANLDDIAKGLHHALKNDDDVSFVDSDRKSDPITQLKFDVVRRVIEVKKEERDAAAKKRENAETKQKIMAIIAERKDGALKSKSDEELQAELAKL